MKKLFALAFACMLFAACSGGSVKDKYLDLIEDATQAIKDAGSAEEIKAVGDEYGKKITEFEEANKEETKELMNDEDVQKALSDYLAACFSKASELKK